MKSNFSLILGQLNRALNNPALKCSGRNACIFFQVVYQLHYELFIFIYFFSVITFLIWYQSSCLNNILFQVTVTSEDVCWNKRKIKFKTERFYNMRCLVMFITAVCLLIFSSRGKVITYELTQSFKSISLDNDLMKSLII